MRVLGLDPSTRTGYCIVDGSTNTLRVESCGEINFYKEKGIQRVQLIGQEVSALIELNKPDLVVIEGYGFANKHTLVTLVEIGTAIRLELHRANLPWGNCAPTQLKKFATMSGASAKPRVMLEVYKFWNFEGTDNEVDAFALAALGLYAAMPALLPTIVGNRRDAVGDWRTDNIRLFG